MKKYILSGALGVTIGMLISLITSAIFSNGHYFPHNPFSDMGRYYASHFNQVTTMAIVVTIWFAIGLLFQAADMIFAQDWSLLRMSVTHFAVSIIGFSVLGILAGWFPLSLGNLIIFWFMFIVIYAVIYWVNYQQMKASVLQINQSLEK